MSEYQYYEFQTIDRPLTAEEQAEIAKLSSRVVPTSRHAVFTYQFGDFPADPEEVLEQDLTRCSTSRIGALGA